MTDFSGCAKCRADSLTNLYEIHSCQPDGLMIKVSPFVVDTWDDVFKLIKALEEVRHKDFDKQSKSDIQLK